MPDLVMCEHRQEDYQEPVNPCEKDLPNRFPAIRLSSPDNKIELQGVGMNWQKMIR